MPIRTKERDALGNLVGKVLSVSKKELRHREEQYRQKAAKNPNQRGPKPKSKVKAST